jgi:hypothetical protein
LVERAKVFDVCGHDGPADLDGPIQHHGISSSTEVYLRECDHVVVPLAKARRYVRGKMLVENEPQSFMRA